MEKIFIIWWWVEYSNYKDYHEYVSNIEFNPYEEKFIWWKDNLSKDLWDKFEVIKIPMPNKDFADYISWKIMFEKAFPYFWKINILIWHSLGWSFLLKYLQENNLENISQIHLVSPAVFDSNEEKLWTFWFDKDLKNFKKFENITNLYFSKDDTIVWFENCEYLQKILKNSKFEIFEDRWHFVTQKNFWELVRNIKRFY